MNLDELTLGQIKQLQSLLGNNPAHSGINYNHFVGKHCVVRGSGSGVHMGVVKEVFNGEVILENARRLYYFKSNLTDKQSKTFTLSEVAATGLSAESKIGCLEEIIYLTPIFEIIPTTEAARKTYEAAYVK